MKSPARASVPGISSVEWSEPVSGPSETWLVVQEGGPASAPRAFRLDTGRLEQETGSLPFKSQLVKSFKASKRFQVLKALRSTLGALTILIVSLAALTIITGSLQLRFVLSDSMAGTFERGDLIAVVSPRFVDIEEGSVIVFNYYNQDRSNLIGDFSHRIIGGNAETGWETKGDANEVPDLSPVLTQDVIGAVIGSIPKVGFLIQPSNLLALALVVIVLLSLGPDARQLIRDRIRSR